MHAGNFNLSVYRGLTGEKCHPARLGVEPTPGRWLCGKLAFMTAYRRPAHATYSARKASTPSCAAPATSSMNAGPIKASITQCRREHRPAPAGIERFNR